MEPVRSTLDLQIGLLEGRPPVSFTVFGVPFWVDISQVLSWCDHGLEPAKSDADTRDDPRSTNPNSSLARTVKYGIV